MKKQKTTQKALEVLHTKQQNFFYENISEKIKWYSVNQDKTIDLLCSIKENVELTVDQFEVLGSFSYLVGIDYVNQQKLTNEICEKVKQRFAIFNFSHEIIQAYVDAIYVVSEKVLTGPKEKLKNKILDKLFLNESDERFAFNNMRANIKVIFNNSLIPVNMVISINEILVKTDYSYDDIIKLNTAITTHCKLNGKKAIKALIKLFTDETWSKYLSKATLLFDNQKFAIIYFDGILSVHESTKKFPHYLYEIISGDISNIDNFDGNFSILENLPLLIEETKETKEVKENVSHVSYTKIPDAEMADISANKPIEFIYHVFCDMMGYHITSKEDIILGIEKMFNEEDYIQHIYHYMKKQAPLVKIGDKFQKIDINMTGIFDEKIQQLREEYKKSVETICKEIPEEKIQKIVSYVNICIGDLLFVTEDQKQYLVSQIMENTITTYQHLMQILDLIENSDINGDQLISYVILHQYLKDITEIEEIFKISENISDLHTKLSIYMGFLDFFKLTEPKPIETEVAK